MKSIFASLILALFAVSVGVKIDIVYFASTRKRTNDTASSPARFAHCFPETGCDRRMRACPNATWSPFIHIGWRWKLRRAFDWMTRPSRLDALSIERVRFCFLSDQWPVDQELQIDPAFPTAIYIASD